MTQKEIAAHLGMSDRNLRMVLARLGLDHKVDSLDRIRLTYIEDLRAQASGHAGDDGESLVKTRIVSEKIDQELKLIKLGEERGAFLPIAEGQQMIDAAIGSMRTILLGAGDRIRSMLKEQYSIEVDRGAIDDHITEAITELSSFGEKLETGDREGAAEA